MTSADRPKYLERNCWCGSGIPYGDCHAIREGLPRLKPSEVLRRYKQAFSRGRCLHPDAGPETCSGKPIRSHSIQRKQALQSIARQGNVYRYDASYARLLSSGQRTMALVGLKKASTFHGFCAKHDAELFGPIDNELYIGRPIQSFLLAYRAIARELFAKEAVIEMIPFLRELDRGRPPQVQRAIQSFYDAYEAGSRNGLRNLLAHKSEMDGAIQRGAFDEVVFDAFFSTSPAVLLSSGTFYPHFDFGGRELQDLGNPKADFSLITCSAAPTPEGFAIVLAWNPASHEVNQHFVSSLANLPNLEQTLPDALFQLIFSTAENHALEPDWWEALSAEQQASAYSQIEHGIDMQRDIEASYLKPNGVRLYDWQVAYIRSSKAA